MYLVTVVNNHVNGIPGNLLKTVESLWDRFVQTVPGVRIHEMFARLKQRTGTAIYRACAGLKVAEWRGCEVSTKYILLRSMDITLSKSIWPIN